MKRLLIVSSVRWSFLWQRHHALATVAAQDGWEVDFLDPPLRGVRHLADSAARRIRRETVIVGENPRHRQIHRVHSTPLLGLLPPGLKLAWLRRSLSPPYDLCLLYLPDPTLVRFAEESADRLIYDEVLDWANVPASWHPPIGYARAEEMMRDGDWIHITDSWEVAHRNQRQGIDGVVVPPAADDAFADHTWTDPVPGGPVIYFGSIREEEIDIELLCRLAKAGVTVRTVGPVVERGVSARLKHAGVEELPPIPPRDLPSAIDSSAALLLPYAADREDSLVPAKLWNCLATNRTIMARGLRLPEDLAQHFTILPASDHEAAKCAKGIAAAAVSRTPLRERWTDRWATVRSL